MEPKVEYRSFNEFPPGLKKVIARTNSSLAAPKNYESVGFRPKSRVENTSESAYTGDDPDYELDMIEE